MTNRFPGYNVLSKRGGMSWNDPTRQAVGERLAIQDGPLFFSADEYRTLRYLCDRILPQAEYEEKVPIAAHVDRHLHVNGAAGTRYEPMPYDGDAWKIALAALNAEAEDIYGVAFHDLWPENADALLTLCQNGKLHNPAWQNVPAEMFFKRRILTDIPAAYYAHPTAWSEIGFGGPASPRGYVRMQADRRDPWEAAEASPGRNHDAARKNAKIR